MVVRIRIKINRQLAMINHLKELKETGQTTFFDGEDDEFGGWSETKREKITLKDLTELYLSGNNDVTKYFSSLYQGDDVGAAELLESIREGLESYIHDEIAMKCNDYYGDEE